MGYAHDQRLASRDAPCSRPPGLPPRFRRGLPPIHPSYAQTASPRASLAASARPPSPDFADTSNRRPRRVRAASPLARARLAPRRRRLAGGHPVSTVARNRLRKAAPTFCGHPAGPRFHLSLWVFVCVCAMPYFLREGILLPMSPGPRLRPSFADARPSPGRRPFPGFARPSPGLFSSWPVLTPSPSCKCRPLASVALLQEGRGRRPLLQPRRFL